MYQSAAMLLEQSQLTPLPRLILENEMRLTNAGEAEIYERLHTSLRVMEASVRGALESAPSIPGDMIAGNACRQAAYGNQAPLSGALANHCMALAFSGSETNASMGRICAAPTAGACGILPAVLFTLADFEIAPREALPDALLVASGIGALITRNASVSGAVAGCQAECGAAAAMAAGAAVWLKGGTTIQVFDASAMALINCMGLICDPVAGLVQFPCALRNASQAVSALISADMALAGTRNIIPFDEAVDAMYRTGRMLPKALRETALGGVAATPAGQAWQESLFPEQTL